MSYFDLVGASWDAVEDSPEPCERCGHELAVHDVGAGCDECGCVYGVDGWALEPATGGEAPA